LCFIVSYNIILFVFYRVLQYHIVCVLIHSNVFMLHN